MKYNLDDIVKYVNEELSAEESAQIEEAIRTDEMTRDLYDGYKMSLFDGVDVDKMAHRINNRIQKSNNQSTNWLKIAVACVFLVGVGYWFFRPQNSQVIPIIVNDGKDSTKYIVDNPLTENITDTVEDEEIIVESPKEPISLPRDMIAFQHNDELELLIAGVRSDNELRQVIPHNQANIKRNANVQFGFNFEYEDMFLLIVKNNKGEIITEKGMIVNKNKASVNISFSKEGLYYWQVEGEDELLHTSSFIVE